MDSNHRRYKPADLQSAPFGHSGILPFSRFFLAISSLDFVSSVGHYLQVTPFLLARPPRNPPKINFEIAVTFFGDFFVGLEITQKQTSKNSVKEL